MKVSIKSKYLLVIRYIFTGLLAVAFFVHFYFLSLAKYNVEDSAVEKSILYLDKINTESVVRDLTDELTIAQATNKKASQVYVKLEQAEASQKGELAPLFFQSLESMANGDYQQATRILSILEQELSSQ